MKIIFLTSILLFSPIVVLAHEGHVHTESHHNVQNESADHSTHSTHAGHLSHLILISIASIVSIGNTIWIKRQEKN